MITSLHTALSKYDMRRGRCGDTKTNHALVAFDSVVVKRRVVTAVVLVWKGANHKLVHIWVKHKPRHQCILHRSRSIPVLI